MLEFDPSIVANYVPDTYVVCSIDVGTLLNHQVNHICNTRLTTNRGYLEGMEEPSEGDWSMGLIEYTISPHWFLAVQDMYNHGNEISAKQLHYVNIDAGFSKGANRFSIGYGKKRV